MLLTICNLCVLLLAHFARSLRCGD